MPVHNHYVIYEHKQVYLKAYKMESVKTSTEDGLTRWPKIEIFINVMCIKSVSYTHLDVYKRQKLFDSV